MSLLRQRALAAWCALETHQTEAVPLVTVASTLAEALISARARPGYGGLWLSRDQIAAARLPTGIDPLVMTAGMLPIGMVCRPQDHNGIVDDVASVVSAFGNTSWLISAGCAVATFLAAYFDGWSKEAALAQALFVAKRGAVLGTKGAERAFVDQLQEAIDAYGQEAWPNADTKRWLSDDFNTPEIVLDALALNYTLDEPEHIAHLLPRLDEAPLLKVTVAMLGAARDPWALSRDLVRDPADTLDPNTLRLIDQLMQIRLPQRISPPLI